MGRTDPILLLHSFRRRIAVKLKYTHLRKSKVLRREEISKVLRSLGMLSRRPVKVILNIFEQGTIYTLLNIILFKKAKKSLYIKTV